MVSNEVGSVTSTPPAIVVVAPPRPGTVVGWGWNDQGQTDVPATGFSGMVSIGAGDEYSIGARMDGSLVYWGFSPSGGDWPQRYAELKGVTGFGAGAPGLMILDESGLILNDTMIYNSPLSAWAGAIAAAAGDAHALVLKHDGSIVIWGENPMVTNVPSTLQSGVVGIAAGGAHTLALKADGSVVAWGSNSSGQTNVPSLARNDVTAIAAGAQHSLALRKDGMVVAWGDNQLGQGTVPALATSGVVAIAAGRYHSVALKADGTMVAWGDNSFGQLDVPEVIQGEVTGIAAGGKHTLAILNTATLQSRLTPAGLVLSWPTNLAGFHLQTSASSLEAAAAWTEVPETLVVVGNRQMVTRPLAGAPQWYRLSR